MDGASTKIATLTLGAFLLLAVASNDHSVAEEGILKVSLDGPVPVTPRAFIFVDGAIAGVLPGTVFVPLEKEVVIEVGFPQLRKTPLYSFRLGPTEFKAGGVDAVTTNFDVGKVTGSWNAIFVAPNNSSTIPITMLNTDMYQISLPSKAYETVDDFIRANKLTSDSPEWFADIPSQNFGLGPTVAHLGYNKLGKEAEYLKFGVDPWSGAYAYAGDVFRLPLRRETWMVKSNPAGATIVTDEGEKGLTDTSIDVAVTGGLYVVLQKDGYVDCPYSKCKMTSNSTGKELVCRLKKKP